MKQQQRFWLAAGLVCLLTMFAWGGVAAASTGHTVWLGPSDGGGWNNFLQVIMQQDYRLQMSNGNPYWNTLMVPVAASSISSGMSSYMGLPAFGFCPVPGQCYMVLVQRPLASSAMVCSPVAPGTTTPNQPGKPNSLW